MSRTVLISCLAAGQPCPSLLTTAACSGLRPEPDCRPRRTFLHLSYSCASPFGPAILVTHDANRTGVVRRSGRLVPKHDAIVTAICYCCSGTPRLGVYMVWITIALGVGLLLLLICWFI